MTPANGPIPPGGRVPPGAPIQPTYAGAKDGAPPAAPSQLTGRKLLFIVLGLVAALGVLAVGLLGGAALLGVKLFEAFR